MSEATPARNANALLSARGLSKTYREGDRTLAVLTAVGGNQGHHVEISFLPQSAQSAQRRVVN